MTYSESLISTDHYYYKVNEWTILAVYTLCNNTRILFFSFMLLSIQVLIDFSSIYILYIILQYKSSVSLLFYIYTCLCNVTRYNVSTIDWLTEWSFTSMSRVILALNQLYVSLCIRFESHSTLVGPTVRLLKISGLFPDFCTIKETTAALSRDYYHS